MVRQFRLYGIDTNTEIDLNDFVTETKENPRSWYLLTNPSGLGFEFINTYINIGSQKIRVAQEQKYKTITGIIEVSGKTRPEWEINYVKLKEFVAKNAKSGFKLYYKSTENPKNIQIEEISISEKYILCDVKIISKEEKNSYCIPVKVEFEAKTLWLDDNEMSYSIKTQEPKPNMYAFMKDDNFSDAWHYNYGYIKDEDFNDVVGTYTDSDGKTHNIYDAWSHNIYYAPQNRGEVSLENLSDAETPLKITIFGECENPEIILLDTNNREVQKCKIYATIGLNERLIINSNPDDLYIILVKGDSGNSEIKTFNTDLGKGYRSFLTLPIGKYTMRIIDSKNSHISANIRYSLQYLGG